ncbi:High-affinity nickel-transport protein [Geobacillus sp. BCO2]|nr:High-affinity nickel-transport protein [Geobacillus sp. BCO2]
MGTMWPVLLFGLLLGMKHATEPDHVIAVSTIAGRTKKLSLSSLAGMFWGIGHTLTLLVVGMAMIAFERQIPEQIASYLEMAVGVMIIMLGIASFRSTMSLDHHRHGEIHHLHVKSTLIGIVHGLAGSAGMVLLTMRRSKELGWRLLLFLIFWPRNGHRHDAVHDVSRDSVCLDESETASHESMDRENRFPHQHRLWDLLHVSYRRRNLTLLAAGVIGEGVFKTSKEAPVLGEGRCFFFDAASSPLRVTPVVLQATTHLE